MVEEPESSLKAGEEEAAQSEELKIPGSFDMKAEPPPHQHHSWMDMLRHLHLKQQDVFSSTPSRTILST